MILSSKTPDQPLAPHLRQGQRNERRAIEFFNRNNLEICAYKKKIFGVEHDYVVKNSKGEIFFVEVKSLACPEDLVWRVSPRQKARLLRSAQGFIDSHRLHSRGVWLLAIENSGQMHFLPLE